MSKGLVVRNAVSASISATLKKAGAPLLTPLNISREKNAMTNILSRLFGINTSWFCKNDTDLINFFNGNFTFPNQASWTDFSPSSAVSVKVLSVLRKNNFEMG